MAFQLDPNVQFEPLKMQEQRRQFELNQGLQQEELAARQAQAQATMALQKQQADAERERFGMNYDLQQKQFQQSQTNAERNFGLQQQQEQRQGQQFEQSLGLDQQRLGIQAQEAAANSELRQQQIIEQKLKNLDARDTSRVKSLAILGAELQPYLETGNELGAKALLEQRKRNLTRRMAAGEDIDAAETDEFISALESGDVNTALEAAKQAQKLGQMLDVIKNPKRASSGANIGGSTGELIDRLMAENPDLTFADALAQVQTGYRQGVNFKGGEATPIEGLPEARATIKRTENYGGESGTQQAQIEAATPKKIAEKAGETIGNARANLGSIEDDAAYTTTLLSKAIEHPGLEGSVGLAGAFPTIPGSKAANFQALNEQIGGRQFLEAYNRLKSGGAISEAEGKKAEVAIGRLQKTQDAASWREAATELQGIISTAVSRARQKAQGSDALPPRDAGGPIATPAPLSADVFEVDF